MKTVLDHPTLDDPLYKQKSPYQTFLLVLCVISSWPLLRGESGSGALEQELSDPAVILWGVCLLTGSVIALVGEFWAGRTWTALVIERAGLVLVGLAAIIYATVVWLNTETRPADVSFLVSLTSAWGTACLWRCWQITRRLAWMRGLLTSLGRST